MPIEKNEAIQQKNELQKMASIPFKPQGNDFMQSQPPKTSTGAICQLTGANQKETNSALKENLAKHPEVADFIKTFGTPKAAEPKNIA